MAVDAGWREANLRAFTTTRFDGGASTAPFDTMNLGNKYAGDGDEPAQVDANRRALVERFGLPSTPRWLRQVHGTRVLRFVADDAGDAEPEADAAVTSEANVVIAILTADCLPVLLRNHDSTEVGGAHAGWRGLADGVLEATVEAMHSPASTLHAWLGPAAGPASYEVGADVLDAFVSRDARDASAFVATRPGHWRVDLYALARRRLADAGIDPSRITGGDRCTIAEPAHFFSHRRDRRTGRMASLLWMADR